MNPRIRTPRTAHWSAGDPGRADITPPPHRVTAAFAAAARGGRAAEAELRVAVCDYTAELRAAGEPPERVLVVMKQLMHDNVSVALDEDEYRDVLDRVVRWCVASYYGNDAGSG